MVALLRSPYMVSGIACAATPARSCSRFSDIDDVRAHGRDERIGVVEYYDGVEFAYRFVKALTGGRTPRTSAGR